MRYFAKIRDFVQVHSSSSRFWYWFFLVLRQLYCILLAILMFVALMLLMLGLFYRVARAEVISENYHYDGVVWGISDVEFLTGSNALNVKQGCIVNAPNAFSAACYAVGGNPNDLSASQRALLSNSSTGGDFYTFSQRFVNYGGSFDLPDWDYPNFYDLWSRYESLYGDALYAADFTQAQLYGAKADFQTILNGGGGGGGSSGGSSANGIYEAEGYYIIPVYQCVPDSYPNLSNAQGIEAVGVVKERYDGLVSYAEQHNQQLLTIVWLQNGTDLRVRLNTCVKSNATFNVLDSNRQYVFRWSNAYNTCKTNDLNLYTIKSVGGKKCICFDGTAYSTDRFQATVDGAFPVVMYSWDGATQDGTVPNPPEPPTNWPDNPSVDAPEPPELPEPYNPIIDDQPIDPTPPQNPIYPPILNITEDTYTADLQGILDAMDAHCQHLRSALHTEMSNLWTSLSTKMTNDFATFRQYMTGQIGWLGDLISDEMEATRDYLKDLFEWLADEFDYTLTGTGYDDNTLISWLRKIYLRLGNGGVNTRPVDPVANPIDAGDWLSQLIANLFSALNALAGGLLTSVGSALDLMHTKFPFSLPWDLLAILALFEASPTAPDFDVPIYTLSSAGQLLQVGAWEIDLSDLSPYLEGIRWMQKICFVYFLAVHTKDWMDTLEKVVA